MHHLVSYFTNKELTEMYIYVALRTLSLAMIAVFIPIYLYEIPGFGFFHVFTYLVIVEVALLFFHSLMPFLFSFLGFKNMIFTSTILTITQFLLLRELQYRYINLYVIAIIAAFTLALYWAAFHVHFKHASNTGKRGREFGLSQTISLTMSVLAPIIGAALILFVGFGNLFYISSLILLFALIPLFMTKNNEHKVSYRPQLVYRINRASFVHFCEGVSGASTLIFWPLFIYVALDQISIVGFASSLGTFLMALVTVYVGKVADVDFKHAKSLLCIGSIGNSISLLIRIFALSVGSIFSVQLLGALSRSYITIPFLKLMYDHKRLSIAEAMVRREFFLHLGKIFSIIVAIMFNYSLVIPIILAGIATLAFNLVKEDA